MDQLSISPFVLSPVLLALFSVYYGVVSPRFATEKQRAYLLSCVSAGTMSCISLPFVWQYARHGMSGLYKASRVGGMRSLGEFGVTFFGTYLFGE
jgi:hypothetical protein